MRSPVQTHAQPPGATGVLVCSDESILWGKGFGATGVAVGEVCFNTSMTGYQEIMTDPSYASQVVTFTFPHIGNVGSNLEDIESVVDSAIGCIVREDVTAPSNFRSSMHFRDWMESKGKIGLSGIDTRALTRRIRQNGAPNAVLAYSESGDFNLPELIAKAKKWQGLEGLDLAPSVTRSMEQHWKGGTWRLGHGFEEGSCSDVPHVVAIDYGAKDNIFRNLVRAGAKVTIVSATASFEDIMIHKPDGVFLSNGPGDPAATGQSAVPVIKQLLEKDIPLFGICLGHQLLALAAGCKTLKMHQGHRGANHPVQRVGKAWNSSEGLVEITSMNHGFTVDAESLPDNVEQTHISLFDGTNCGISIRGRKAFSVQYHPEASPGPQDSFYLFEKFVSSLVL